MPESAVEIRGVWKTYGSLHALRDVSFDVPHGRVLAVLGPNGAGKSTLLRVIAGIARPTRGDVLIAGRRLRDDRAHLQAVGFAGHHSMLYGHLTAEENLRFFAGLHRLTAEAVDAALEHFELTAYRHRQVRDLSRGLVQRLSLARALLHDPRILLLDEPFTGLDARAAAAFAGVLDRFRRDGRAVIVALHRWEETRELADDTVVLVAGRLALSEPAHAVNRERLVALYQPT